jgi:nucleoid-associated protein YgaU
VIQAPAQAPVVTNTPAGRERTVPPVATYNVPSVIPREGVPYRVRYGDTLWDIAEAFYRNPWLYPRIAQFNNIRNPDLIIAGTTIRVPPRN